MLFNSYEFIFLFLPLTFFIYFALSTRGYVVASKVFLVLASLFFYSWWNVKYLPLILASLLVNYFIGKQLITGSKIPKKILLWIGIAFNLGLLGYFKYADFFLTNFNRWGGTDIPLLHLALPLAISFYTFQQIAYLVDSYRGDTKEYNFLNYAVFVTFFPQLIAGPIVHHKEMMPQFARGDNKTKNYDNIALGLFIFGMGLFKKVAIADTFAVWATKGFDEATTLNMLEAWATSLSYTFQLYFDFSGYTDMAIGAALLFNIKLPINFNSPYKATSIQDFWRRWHITLSRFLKDYIYIPLGGNRKGSVRTYSNLFMTFLLGGIWHGAGWMFVVWGMLHGLGLIVHRIWSTVFGFKLPTVLAWFITFNFINITWIFFRATDMSSAMKVLQGMFMGEWQLPKLGENLVLYGWSKLLHTDMSIYWFNTKGYLLWLLLLTLLAVVLFPNSTQFRERFRTNWFYLLFSVILFSCLLILHRQSEFLYFNF